MKVLSIGNSFSQDAHKWLHKLAKLNGGEMETVNLYIGGCSLKTHWDNVLHNAENYDLERNGNKTERKITIDEALEMEDWDVVTVQQVSSLSGLPESYEPYLSELVKRIRTKAPHAQLWFHQTWAYEIGSGHSGFPNYDCDQKKMYNSIVTASQKAAASIDARLIPAGTVIQTLRETIPEFDYQKGGLSLCRDTYHLTYDYGRFAAAATWLRALTGKQVTVDTFEDFDTQLLQKILAVVNA